MADELNNAVDEQLKAYAEERRGQAGGPFEMPSHTRQVLRAEAARLYGQAGASPAAPAPWWHALWPKVTIGACATALLALALMLVWEVRKPASSPKKLALAKPQSTRGGLAEKGVAPEPAAAAEWEWERAPSPPAAMPPQATQAVAESLSTEEARRGEAGAKEKFGLGFETHKLSAAKEQEVRQLVIGKYGGYGSSLAKAESDGKTPVLGDTTALGQSLDRKSEERLAEKPGAPALDLAAVEPPRSSSPAPASPPPSAARTLGETVSARSAPPAMMRYGLAPTGRAMKAEPPAAAAEPSAVGARADALGTVKTPMPGRAPKQPTSGPAAGVEGGGAGTQLAKVEPLSRTGVLVARPEEAHALARVEVKPTLELGTQLELERHPRGATFGFYAGDAVLGDTNQTRQRFVRPDADRQYRRNFNSSPRPRVLAEFDVQVAGTAIQITDSDGSVYEGRLQRGKALAGGQLQGGAGTTAAGAYAQAPETYDMPFRAVGTNKVLGRYVIFDGRLVVTNQPVLTMFTTMQNTVVSEETNTPGSWLGSAAVRGRVTIGGRTQMDINAVPAP